MFPKENLSSSNKRNEVCTSVLTFWLAYLQFATSPLILEVAFWENLIRNFLIPHLQMKKVLCYFFPSSLSLKCYNKMESIAIVVNLYLYYQHLCKGVVTYHKANNNEARIDSSLINP